MKCTTIYLSPQVWDMLHGIRAHCERTTERHWSVSEIVAELIECEAEKLGLQQAPEKRRTDRPVRLTS